MADLSPYSHLNPNDQQQVSLMLADVDTVLASEVPGSLEKIIADAPPRLVGALLSQALPSFIQFHRTRHGVTPTLHELRLAHPDLAEELTQSYPWIPAPYQLPVEIRGYRILSVIGEGGQSVVLRAQDDVHSAVAIKLSTSVDHNEFVLRERKLLGECDHPGIIRVISSGNHEGRAYFVMPHLRGATLADQFAVRKSTTTEATRIMTNVCSALDHLHQRGILHRDIKPANIWLDESGETKLIDLGMAVQRASWSQPLPPIAEFHGTPAFMSPEQASSDGTKDSELSDLFSAGATLYWMLTGSAPFAAKKPAESMSLAATGQFDKDLLLSSVAYPQTLKRLCLKAMATDPADRFPSAAELGEQLRKISQQPLRSRSSKLVKAVTAFALLLLLAGLVVSTQSGVYSQWLAGSSSTPLERVAGKLILESKELRWVDRVASSQGIDLAAIKPTDFQVSVTCRQRGFQPWGSQKPNPETKGALFIHLDTRLKNLAEALEYRLGDLAWNKLVPAEIEGAYTAALSPEATAHHGPVELRFASEVSGESECAVGPFRFEVDVAQALKDDEQAFGQELLKEATTAKCFDVAQPGWAIRDEYSRRLTPIIDEFWFGEKRDGPMTSVSARLDKLAGTNREAGASRPGYNLRQGFLLASKKVQGANKLWVKIRFSDGGTWGPVLYEKPLTEAQKEKQRVLAWFDRLGPDDKLAQLRRKTFVLTRLNEILPSLTHLHFAGKRTFVDGDPTHVESSKAADPKKNKIVERPSSEMVVDLSKIAGDRTIEILPVWSPVSVRGRFPDGTFTPSFVVHNSEGACCCCSVSPFDASSREADRELYVYIDDDTLPNRRLSIVPFLPNLESLSQKVIKGCERTRLSFASPLPEGAVRVEYYSDSGFTDRVETAQPGILYARYVNADKGTVGYSAYKLSDAFMRVWVDHALGHAGGPPSE